MREHILNEIRRLAAANGGRAPGRSVFWRETGIRESAWRGIYWARWSDAVAEAGCSANELQGPLDEAHLLEKLAQAFRHYGRVPTTAELRMYRQVDPDFPWHLTLGNRFPRKAEMLAKLRAWAVANGEYGDVAAMIPDTVPEPAKAERPAEGFVYLLRSGAHFKIGRSDESERRVKEIRIALPEAAQLVHAIRTDGPPGIEAYWHRRFAARRANGEWFKLTPGDVAAFKRRRYQ